MSLTKKFDLFSKRLFLVCTTALMLLFLASCSLNQSNINSDYDVNFDHETNQTYVNWKGPIYNNSLLNINSITLKLGYYLDGNLVSESSNYNLLIDIGVNESKIPEDLDGYVEGEIDEVRIIYLYEHYEPIFATYQWWIVGFIVLLIIYTVFLTNRIVSKDLFFEDLAGFVRINQVYLITAVSTLLLINVVVFMIAFSVWFIVLLLTISIMIASVITLVVFFIKQLTVKPMKEEEFKEKIFQGDEVEPIKKKEPNQ